MNTRRGLQSNARPWMPAIAAGLVLVMVIGIGVYLGRGDSSANDTVSALAPVGTAATTATSITSIPDPAPAPTFAPLAATLNLGSSGEDVRRVQQRLSDLGFQPGPIDGQFGSGTQQAVWAFKKLIDNVSWDDFSARDDQTAVTNALWQQMEDPAVQIVPRRPIPGTHVEVYLPLQVMAVFRGTEPIFVSHISSGQLNPDGTPATFCETATYDTDENGNPYPEPVTKQVCAETKTPGGVFKMRRYYDGNRVSPLGGMKNPWYFNYGIAIHGAYNVPTSPASHGCIRLSNTLADVFPALVERGDQVFVWGHDGKDPEQYSERESLPSFNRPDPNATTTTSSTTTTTTIPATTIPTTTPPTTAAPATTAATTTTPPTTTPSTTAPPTTAAATTTTIAVAPLVGT